MTEEWKTIEGWPRYELSNRGAVRVKKGEKNSGYILSRFWRDEDGKVEPEHTHSTHGRKSLCVELWNTESHTTKRLWRLMEIYWPEVQYPEYWKIRRNEIRHGEDKRRKLTDRQIIEIKASDMSPSELADLGVYPVGRRWISRIKNGR